MTRIRMGDTVVVTAGAQRGETGRVLNIDHKHGKALVEGINLKWKHQPRSQEKPQGGRTQREYPIDLSNLSYYDAAAGKGVRLSMSIVDGKKVRVLRSSGQPVDG